jgi:hypothetical protein
MRDFILTETILGLEPGVRQITVANEFPFGVHWDYYGIIEDEHAVRLSKNTARIAVER